MEVNPGVNIYGFLPLSYTFAVWVNVSVPLHIHEAF